MTGAGMVDCQKALQEAGQDLEKAVDILRKKGIAKAAKRLDREAKEGVIKVAVSDAKTDAVIVEINSETDFVARNEKFQSFADQILELVKTQKPATVEALLALPLNGTTVQESLDHLSGTTGEKMGIKRLDYVSGASVAAYSHLGGRLGVLVALDKPGQEALAMDIAMQVAAANPRYILSSEVATEEMDREKVIYKEQLLKEGKPAEMVEKIVAGKMGKYYSEVCLVEQEYIKDDKKKVKDILAGANVLKFVRFAL